MGIIRFDGSAIPRAIIGGVAARKNIARETERIGLKRILVVCGPRFASETSFAREIRDSLGARAIGLFDRVPAHVPDMAVMAACAELAPMRPDAVLSLGGGAAHDMAKALAVGIPSGRSIVDFVARFEPPSTFHSVEVDVEPLPVLTVPSTFSAADVVGGGAVTDTKRNEKLIFVHPKLTPVAVFLDGEVVRSTPRPILLASAMNAVHHCLEAFYSKGHQSITDAFAMMALCRLVRVLPELAPERADPPLASFQEALEAASMSGLTYANSWLGIGHSVCHSLGGRYGLSHGAANSVMVRQSIRFNMEHARGRLALLGRALGAMVPDAQEIVAARHVVATVDWLSELLGTPRSLREIGLPPDQFDRIATDVMADPQTYWNPRPATYAEVVELLRGAW